MGGTLANAAVPGNASPPTRPAAAAPTRKIRRVHLHGATSGPAKTTSRDTAATSSAGTEVKEGLVADKGHTISGRTLSEIACILRAAGNEVMVPADGKGIITAAEEAMILQKVLEGADDSRLRRSLRDLQRLRDFAGEDPWLVSVQTLCRFFVLISRNGPTAAAGVWHQLDWWRSKFGMALPTRQPYAIAFKTAKPGQAIKQAPELQAGALMRLMVHARGGAGITM